MAQKFLSAEEAAKILGISVEKLNDLRERREVFGVRDGSTWKFKSQDIEKYAEEQAFAQGGGGDEELSLQADGDEDNDSFLLSELELGESGPSSSGTVIGAPGDVRMPSDSDLELGTSDRASDSKLKSDSDVKLVADSTAKSDSGVRLVAASDSPSGSAAARDMSGTVELELSNLSMDDDDSNLPFDLEPAEKGGSRPGSSGVRLGGSGTKGGAPGSDLTLDAGVISGGSGIGLGDSSVPLSGVGRDSPTGSGSGIDLGIGDFEDDDLVLGSHTGSDISDSGISLADPADSGLSLEQPLDFGGKEMQFDEDDLGGEGDLTADDEFLLTPAVEMEEEEIDESGSQVIALDTEGEYDDSAATMLGGELGQQPALEADMFAGAAVDPLGAGQMMATGPALMGAPQPIAREASYTVLNVLFLGLCVSILGFTGMFMFDLMRNMWSWQGTYDVNSSLMDSIIGMFES